MTGDLAWAVTVCALALTVMTVAMFEIGLPLPGVVFASGVLAVTGAGAVAGMRARRQARRGWTPEDKAILNGRRELR